MYGPPWITEHPDYWRPEVYCSCGEEATEEREDIPMCEECIKKEEES